jgi:hypothetical protein
MILRCPTCSPCTIWIITFQMVISVVLIEKFTPSTFTLPVDAFTMSAIHPARCFPQYMHNNISVSATWGRFSLPRSLACMASTSSNMPSMGCSLSPTCICLWYGSYGMQLPWACMLHDAMRWVLTRVLGWLLHCTSLGLSPDPSLTQLGVTYMV